MESENGNLHNTVYSIIVVAARAIPAAPSTAVTQCGFITPIALEDRRWIEVSATGGVTFRSSCVGSMLGSVEIWNIGATGLPSNWNRWSLNPVVGSLKILQPL